MGLMDMIGNAVASFSTNNSGNNEYPGAFCTKPCVPGGDQCSACLELQNLIEKELQEIEQIEAYIDCSTEEISDILKNRIKECSFCGAPAEYGESACPYCGTEYEQEIISGDIPIAKAKRNELFRTKAGHVWQLHLDRNKYVSENLKKNPPSGFLGKAMSLVAGLADSAKGIIDQSGEDVLSAAGYYKISVTDYLRGAIKGTYNTYPQIRMQEESVKLSIERAEKQKAYDENMSKLKQMQEEEKLRKEEMRAQEKELEEKLRKQKREHDKQFMEMLHSSGPPQYSAGGGGGAGSTDSHGQCCGNCRYYMPADKRCLYYVGTSGEYTKGPSDYCNRFSRL